jgi:rhamnosyltransferase
LLLQSFGFKRVAPTADQAVDVLITSGCLTDLILLKQLGGFLESLFIDYVDTELCLRSKLNGLKIVVSRNAILFHSLGRKTQHLLGSVRMQTTNHVPLRRYYIARNAIYMHKNYAVAFPGWAAFDIIANGFAFFKILAFEQQKFTKIQSILSGWTHGLVGKSGSAPVQPVVSRPEKFKD